MKGILGIIILVLDILAIVDCLKSSKSNGQKALWVIVILVLMLKHFIVTLVVFYQ